AIERLRVDFRSGIVTSQTCSSQIDKVLAIGQELDPHLADLSRKQGSHRRSVPAGGRNAQDRTVHCLGKEDRPIRSPGALCCFWNAADHLGDSTRSPKLLQLAPRPETDELRVRRPEWQKRILTVFHPLRF